MKVLVTGASGQVGRALADGCPSGVELAAFARTDLDITDEEQVERAVSAHLPDMIINAAAYTAVDQAEREPALADSVNHQGPANLARVARKHHCRLLHVSTDFVFDGKSNSPYAPDHLLSPVNAYGQSKARGELAIRNIAPDSVVVRTSWVYAAEGNNFMRTMLRLMAVQPVSVVGDQIGTPTHSRSLARALWELSRRPVAGVFHYTDSGIASWYDFAVAIGEEACAIGLLDRQPSVTPIRTDDYPTPARRPAYSVLDKTSTYALLGQPAPHWRVELRAALIEFKGLANG